MDDEKQGVCPHCGQAMKGEEQDTDDANDVDDLDQFGESIAKAVVSQMRKNGKRPSEKYESEDEE